MINILFVNVFKYFVYFKDIRIVYGDSNETNKLNCEKSCVSSKIKTKEY